MGMIHQPSGPQFYDEHYVELVTRSAQGRARLFKLRLNFNDYLDNEFGPFVDMIRPVLNQDPNSIYHRLVAKRAMEEKKEAAKRAMKEKKEADRLARQKFEKKHNLAERNAGYQRHTLTVDVQAIKAANGVSNNLREKVYECLKVSEKATRYLKLDVTYGDAKDLKKSGTRKVMVQVGRGFSTDNAERIHLTKHKKREYIQPKIYKEGPKSVVIMDKNSKQRLFEFADAEEREIFFRDYTSFKDAWATINLNKLIALASKAQNLAHAEEKFGNQL